jgi:hypothetical protein
MTKQAEKDKAKGVNSDVGVIHRDTDTGDVVDALVKSLDELKDAHAFARRIGGISNGQDHD